MNVNIVATCTNRKLHTVPSELRLRSVYCGTLQGRFNKWIGRLEASQAPKVAARKLYAGEHWSVIRNLDLEFAGQEPCVWVCSSGYGLIPVDVAVTPYSATFSNGHPDSVIAQPGSEKAALWWKLLGSWKGVWEAPRSLTELAREFPTVPMIVVASGSYLDAMIEDLQVAASTLQTADLLTIVSVGTKCLPGLNANLLPCDMRLKRLVGGTNLSLNARLVRRLLQEHHSSTLTASSLKLWASSVMEKTPALEMPRRLSQSDAQIKQFIKKALQVDSGVSCNRLLRKFRDGGSACEQSRFASLYLEVRRPTNAHQ